MARLDDGYRSILLESGIKMRQLAARAGLDIYEISLTLDYVLNRRHDKSFLFLFLFCFFCILIDNYIKQ